MNTAAWFLLIGSLLLAMGFTAHFIQKLPVTSAMIYLIVGLIVGPMGFGLFHFNPLEESGLLELLTEVAVLISLFSAGVKMPVPMTFKRWRNPLQLAFISMALTVGLVTLFAHYWLALPLGAAVLLGAIVAPTDPVLATDVQVRHAGDRDRLRFALTCEAGMNDGSAFPFVMLGLGLLGLHELGDAGVRWLLVDVLWATAAGLAIGAILGFAVGLLISKIRKAYDRNCLLEDFLGLGLIALVYGLSLAVNAWGFLAVFAAAVALRHTETKLAEYDSKSVDVQTASVEGEGQLVEVEHVSDGSLVFKEHLERLSELLLILLLGGSLFWDSWSLRALSLAMFVFFIARPVSVYLGLLGTQAPMRLRGLAGWFGVRGIGSMYYLMYAIQHGLPEDLGLELLHLTLVVVTLSILVHGISVKPLIARYWARVRTDR